LTAKQPRSYTLNIPKHSGLREAFGGKIRKIMKLLPRSRNTRPVSLKENPKTGYAFAVFNMVISGIAIFVNSLGVQMFSDAVLYTLLKNAVVGVALLFPLFFRQDRRSEYRSLSARQWMLLVMVSLIGGSIAYALFFMGLQVTTPVTASVIAHSQFLIVAILAAIFLRERFHATIWLALFLLLAGLTVGLKVSAVRWDAGVPLIISSTILFATDFVIMKYLLRSVSIFAVMTFKMSLGAALLCVFVAATGHMGAVLHLSLVQWGFVIVTGLILLAFTATSILGLRYASATAVTAIPAAAPIVTTLLVIISRQSQVPPSRWLGLSLILLAVTVVFIIGRRQEVRAYGDN